MTVPTPCCATVDGTCPELVLDRFAMRYGRHPAVAAIDLAIPPCAITAIVGPSGCGKSSLLAGLNRLDELVPGAVVTGSVRWRGRDVRARDQDVPTLRRSLALIAQRPVPFPLSIANNLALPLRDHGCPRTEVAARSERALRQVGLWEEVRHRLGQSATTLSGGQQQRLCLARALALGPEVLLLDEPCSALDPVAAGVIEDLIVSLRGFYTVVLVTHDLAQARRVADHVAILWPTPHGGRLVVSGGPDQLDGHTCGDPAISAYLRAQRVAGATTSASAVLDA